MGSLFTLRRSSTPFVDRVKDLLDHRGLRFALSPLANHFARSRHKGVKRVFYDSGAWIHDTTRGFFAYHQPFVRLDMAKMDDLAQKHFFWGYRPQPGDVVIDVGAGVGEEALTLSRAVGEGGKVICIEAHPRTYHCLKKLVHYNRLENLIPIQVAITDTSFGTAVIEDSNAYLSNRLHATKGIPVPATTIDALHRTLWLGQIQFLKMNIEGAERFAIRGMTETLQRTEVLCISCHDFLAEETGDDALRTKQTITEFFQDHGFRIDQRLDPNLPPYLRDQVWGFNRRLMKMRRPAS